MPIERVLDKVERLLRTTIVGPISIAQVREHVGLLRRTGASQMPELIDLRDAARSGFSPADVLALVHEAHRSLSHMTPARRAVVVQGALAWDGARRVASLVAGWMRVGVFEDVASAELWLRGPVLAAAAVEEPAPLVAGQGVSRI